LRRARAADSQFEIMSFRNPLFDRIMTQQPSD
jgi:hypothetical protein